MPAEEARAAKAANEAAIFARANVVGVGIGNKMIRGRETGEPCIVVFVEAKRPEAQLRHRDVVPKAFGAVRTDVVETGRFHARRSEQAMDLERTKRIRPAPGGVSIGHVQITAGTLGLLARRHGRPVILSNNHVLANQNAGHVGDSILQPGPADGGRLQDTIARLVDFVPIQFKEPQPGPIARFLARLFGPLLRAAGWGLKRLPSGRSNLVDAAVAEPIETRIVAPEILGIGRVRGTTEPDIGLRVRKSGRTTGVTAGRITAIDAVVEVDYDGPTAIFREQIVSDLLSKGGDSGSLVVDEGRHAVRLPPKAYYATVGFAARWGGDEGTLGREVSTEEPGRGRRPGGDRRAPPGLCEDGKPSPPPLRGSGGHRQDDVCNRPGPRHVRRELAPELL